MAEVVGLRGKIQLDGGARAAASLKALATQAFATRGAMLGLGAGLAAIAGAAAAGASIKAAIAFESAMAGVAKTVDESDEVIAALGREFQALSQEIPTAANELANLGEIAGQLGIRTENIVGFVKVMADLGTTTNLSGADAAKSLARLSNIMGTSQSDFDRLGSVIVELGNNFATTEREIVEMTLRLAGAGKIIGLSEADILGMAAALSSVGIRAEAGGTAFSRVFAEIGKAVAGGGDAVKNFAIIAGQSSADFQQAFKRDAQGAITSFVEGLGDINEAGGDLFAVLDEIGFGNVRVRDTLLRAAGAGDLLREAIRTSNDEWIVNLALVEEARKRYATTAAQIDIAQNRIVVLAVALGEKLKPAFLVVLDVTEAVLKVIAKVFKVDFDTAVLTGLERLDATLKEVRDSGRLTQDQFEQLTGGIRVLADRLSDQTRPVFLAQATEIIRTMSGTAKEAGNGIKALFDSLKKAEEAADAAGDSTVTLSDELQALLASLKDTEGAAEDAAGGIDTFRSAAEQLRDDINLVIATMKFFGIGAGEVVELSREARLATIAWADAYEALTRPLFNLLTQFDALEGEVEDAGAEVDTATRFVLDMVSALDVLDGGLQRSISQFILFGGEIIKAIGAMNKFGATAAEQAAAARDLQSAIGGAGLALGSIISQGTQGKGVRAVVGSTVSGAAAGFAAGGPVGAAIGGGVGLVTGILGSIFGQNEADKFEEEMKILLRLFSENADAAKALAEAIGQDLLETLRGLASIDFGDKLSKDEVEDFEAALRGMGLTLSDIEKFARAAGIDISEFLRVMITGKGDRDLAASQFDNLNAVLALTPDIVLTAADSLQTLLDETGLTFEQLKERAAELGVDITNLSELFETGAGNAALAAAEFDALNEALSAAAEAARIVKEAMAELNTDLDTLNFKFKVFGTDLQGQFDAVTDELNEALAEIFADVLDDPELTGQIADLVSQLVGGGVVDLDNPLKGLMDALAEGGMTGGGPLADLVAAAGDAGASIADFALALGDFDLATQEGRDAAREAIRELVKVLGDDLPEGARRAVLLILGIVDEADRAAASMTGRRQVDPLARERRALRRELSRAAKERQGITRELDRLSRGLPGTGIEAQQGVSVTGVQANEILSVARTNAFDNRRTANSVERSEAALLQIAQAVGGDLLVRRISQQLGDNLVDQNARQGVAT